MSTAKTERLMNLLIMLLVQKRFVAKQRIREILYAEAGDEAFERMFERDKEELRSLGVPVEVGHMDAYFDDEPGYRIRPDEFALPEIDLAPDEAAVVGLATRVWEHQKLAHATTEAVRKLTAAGAEIDLGALDIAQPRLPADEPSFDLFFDAILERSVVEFDYWRTGTAGPTVRRLQPWGVTRYSGRWYVVGYDLDRADERVFRLSRVQGAARKVGRPGAYVIPEGTDISAATRRLAPDLSTEPVVVLVRTGSALPLRRAADSVETGVAGPDTATTWDRLTLTRASVGVADEVLGFGAAVVVEAPASLRDQVVARLEAVVSPVSPASGSASGAKDQVARLLTLVPYLHARGTVRLAEAGAALGVTPETMLKDLKVLFMCGTPGGYPDELIDVDLDALETEDGAVRGDGVITVSNADYLARPLRLTPIEASAMIVALRALRAGSAPDTAEIVDRVLAKLETAAASGPVGVPVDAAPDERDDTAELELAARLDDAVTRRVQVELDYYVPARDELSHRVVDPRGVVRSEGNTYLDAWCHSAEAPRLFRLDRIAAARVLDTPVLTAPEAPRDLSDGMFSRSEETTRVTLLLGPAARWVTEYYPVEEVRPAPDGSVEVDLLVADERWLTKLLLRLAPNASVVAPSAYGAGLTDAAQAALSLYR